MGCGQACLGSHVRTGSEATRLLEGSRAEGRGRSEVCGLETGFGNVIVTARLQVPSVGVPLPAA